MREDAELVELLRAGDAGVVLEVRGWIRSGLARSHQWRWAEVEDLEQEVLLALLESLDAGRFKGESRLETYVRAFARFKSTDRIRAAARRAWVDLEDEVLVSDAPNPLEEFSQREAAAIARQVVESLPEPCRVLWRMIAQGLSYREMSRLTGLAEGAIRVRAHRCRQRALEARRRRLSGDPL